MGNQPLRYPTRLLGPSARVVDAENSPLRFLSLDKLRLQPGQECTGDVVADEALVVLLAGKCSVRLTKRDADGPEGCRGAALDHVLARSDVFTANPTAVYSPPGWTYSLRAERPTEALVVRAPWAQPEPVVEAPKPFFIAPRDVRVVSVGVGNWRRDVRFILPPESPACRLIAAETLNPPGNWSGFPPHKHDRASPDEAVLEELYHFSIRPADSYGIQRVYAPDASVDEAMVVHDGDVVAFPGGYHPTVAPPGTTLCYFWAIAGPTKELKVSLDARYAWLGLAESIIREMQRSQAL